MQILLVVASKAFGVMTFAKSTCPDAVGEQGGSWNEGPLLPQLVCLLCYILVLGLVASKALGAMAVASPTFL